MADNTTSPSPGTPAGEPNPATTVEPSSQQPATQAAPAAAIESPPTGVEPQTQTTETTTPAPVGPDALQREIDKLIAQRDEARQDASKNRRKRQEAAKNAGNFEELYSDANQELAELAPKYQQATAQVEALTTRVQAAETEIAGYRKALVAKFDEADQETAKGMALSGLPGLYERLYGKTIMQAPPSPGAGKPTNGRQTATEFSSLEDYNAHKYGTH